MADQTQMNQRVVYHGLRRMTTSRNDINAGFQRWQEKFQGLPLDVIDVVTDLVAHLGLDINEKKALMIGMHSASGKLFDELEPVPTVFLKGGAALVGAGSAPEEKTETVSNRKVEVDMLERFLQTSCQYLQRNKASAHTELTDILIDEGLPSGANKQIKAWAQSGLTEIRLPDSLSKDDCQSLAHDLYNLVSEVVGPVVADTIINRTIDDLLVSEIAQRFDPRELL